MCGMLSSTSRDGGDVAQVVAAGGVVLEPHVVVLGVVGERDEGVEAAGLVLQGAQAQQVVDLVLGRSTWP